MRRSAWRNRIAFAAVGLLLVLLLHGCRESKPVPSAAAGSAAAGTAVQPAAPISPPVFSRPPAGPPKLMVALGHQDFVASAAFSPDGKFVLTGGGDNNARLWETASGDEIRVFIGHSREVLTVAFSPDRTRILTGSADGSAILWDTDRGTILHLLKHDGPVNSVAFSDGGRQVLSGSSDGSARLWYSASGTAIKTFDAHAGAVYSVAISHDGSQLLAGYDDGSARLWDIASAVVVHRFKTGGRVNAVAISPDGRHLLTGGEDHRTAVVGLVVERRREISRVQARRFGAVRGISRDGKQVLTGCDDNFGRLWDADTGKQIRQFRHDGVVRSIAMSTGGRQILTASEDDTARAVERDVRRANSRIRQSCVSGRVRGDLRRRQANFHREPRPRRTPVGRHHRQTNPTVSARHSIASGSPRKKLARSHGHDHVDCSFGRRYADADRQPRSHCAPVGCGSGNDSQRISSSRKDGRRAGGLVVPDGKTLLTGSDDGAVRDWKAASDKPVRQFPINGDGKAAGNAILSIAFSRDGSRVRFGTLRPRSYAFGTSPTANCSIVSRQTRTTSLLCNRFKPSRSGC